MLVALMITTFRKQVRRIFTGRTEMDLTPNMGEEDKRKGISGSLILSPVAASLTNFPPTQYFKVIQTLFVKCSFTTKKISLSINGKLCFPTVS